MNGRREPPPHSIPLTQLEKGDPVHISWPHPQDTSPAPPATPITDTYYTGPHLLWSVSSGWLLVGGWCPLPHTHHTAATAFAFMEVAYFYCTSATAATTITTLTTVAGTNINHSLTQSQPLVSL